MAVTKRGLGRGLDALLGGGPEQASVKGGEDITKLPLDSIRPNPKQPRQDFTESALDELTESIRSKGVLQPILVRPIEDEKDFFELVAGERRWRAAGRAGLAEIPVMIRALTDEESLAIALIENLQREDLNPIEEAKGYMRLLQDFGISQEELAKQMGKSRSAVANSVRLLKLPENVRASIKDGILTAGHGRALMAVDNPEVLEQLHSKIVKHSMSVRQTEADAAFFREHGTLPLETEQKEAVKGSAQKGGSPNSREPKVLDGTLADMLEQLDEFVTARVRVTGNLQKGSISFHYKNTTQLAELAERLGISEIDFQNGNID